MLLEPWKNAYEREKTIMNQREKIIISAFRAHKAHFVFLENVFLFVLKNTNFSKA